MDKKIAIDLIKLDVLNLSTKQDFEALDYLKRKDDDFPWKELGEYQNLIAVIAVTSKLETPPANLKLEIISKATELKKQLFVKEESLLSDHINSDSEIDIFNKSTTGKKVLETNNQTISDKVISHSSGTLQEEMVIPVSAKIAADTILSDGNIINVDIPDSIVEEKTNGSRKNIEVSNRDSFSNKEKEIITFRDPDLLNLQTLLKNRPSINLPESDQTKDNIETKSIINGSGKKDQLSEFKEKSNNISTIQEIPDLSFVINENMVTSFNEKIYDSKIYIRTRNSGSKRGFILLGIIILLTLPILLYLLNASVEIKTNENPIVVEQKDPVVEEQINDQNSDSNEIVEEIPAQVTEEKKVNKTAQDKNQLPPLPSSPKPIETSQIAMDNKEISTGSSKSEIDSEVNEAKLIPPVENKRITEETPYFVAVEEMPEPIGGIADIQKRVVYPKIASLSGVEGRVIINAYVSETGNVTRTEVVKGIGAGCDESAVEAVLNTKFKPGKQRGNPVNVRITIPILFKKN